jgi:Domain of unknown function (DUF4279)
MAKVWKSVASLRFSGDNLSPDEVTRALGGEPHERATKGELLGSGSAALTGVWLRRATDQMPGDVDVQIRELLVGLTEDPANWIELSARFRADIFVGLFLNQPNEGLGLRPETLAKLAERGLDLSLDIYST